MALTEVLHPVPRYAAPAKMVLIFGSCGHFRVVQTTMWLDLDNAVGLSMVCRWCRRTTLDSREICRREVTKAFPAPPGAQVT